GTTQESLEVFDIGVERAEDQTAVRCDTRHGLEVLVSLVEARGIATFVRDPDQFTRRPERPAVIRTDKGARVAGFLTADRGAPVRTGIEHRVYLTITSLGHDDGAGADLCGLEVPRLCHFAFVAQVD